MQFPGVLIRRRDPNHRMARYHLMTLQRVLGGGFDLILEWGRIGSPGQIKAVHYDDHEAAEAAMRAREGLKRRKGYG